MSENVHRMNQSVMRVATDVPRRGLSAAISASTAILEHVTDTANGADKFMRKGIIHLRPQSSHMHLDNIRVAVEVDIPDFLRNKSTGQDLARSSHEKREKLKLLWCHVENAPGPQRTVPNGVYL